MFEFIVIVKRGRIFRIQIDIVVFAESTQRQKVTPTQITRSMLYGFQTPAAFKATIKVPDFGFFWVFAFIDVPVY